MISFDVTFSARGETFFVLIKGSKDFNIISGLVTKSNTNNGGLQYTHQQQQQPHLYAAGGHPRGGGPAPPLPIQVRIFFRQIKVEKILKGSLDLIPSPSLKIQIMDGKVCLRRKGKTLLGIVSKLFVFKSLLTTPSNVLPLHLFRSII